MCVCAGMDRLVEMIGRKIVWLDHRPGLLDSLYMTNADAIEACKASEKQRGGEQ